MATFKLIQVSDTHLSRERPFFVPNWGAVVAHVNAAVMRTSRCHHTHTPPHLCGAGHLLHRRV